MLVGNDPARADIRLSDLTVADLHAKIELLCDTAIISCISDETPVIVNDKPVVRALLEERTTLQIGETRMIWELAGSGL